MLFTSSASLGVRKAAEIDVARFDAIVVPGGQSPMFTFDQATALHQKFVEFYETGKIGASICRAMWRGCVLLGPRSR